MTTIASRLQDVRDRIATACRLAGRRVEDVTLLAVSKTCPPEAVRAAHAAGQRAFGENYVQEGVDKITALADVPGLQWHCIGPIQSNKTRLVAEHFDWVHTVDRLKIAERLSAQRPPHLPPLNVCVQINLDGGPRKSGVPPQEALALMQAAAALPRLRLRGLMSLPDAADLATTRTLHHAAHALLVQCQTALPLDTLSLGMSADLEPAIAAGSTMVRAGSAVFGARAAKTV